MKKSVIIFLTLFAAAIVIGMTVHLSSSKLDMIDASLKSPMDADKPLAMPADGKLDFRCATVSVWERMATPVIHRMDRPMGSESGALAYNAQPFAAMNEARGGPHLGDDWNGIGGMNTDLGDPIHAAADGIVVYAGEPSPGWGKVLILLHRLPDGTTIQTMYAHLYEIHVALSALVGRGQIIATNGTANGHYPAHLHYEARIGTGIDIGAGYGHQHLNRKNPEELRAPLAAAADQLTPSPLALHNAAQLAADPTQTLEIGGKVERLLDLMEKKN